MIIEFIPSYIWRPNNAPQRRDRTNKKKANSEVGIIRLLN